MNRYARLVLVVVFVGLLLTPFLIRRFGQPAGARAAVGARGPAGAVRLPPDRVRRRPPGSTSSTTRRRSIRSWRTSCRRSRRWARRSRSSTSIATACPTSTSPTARKARSNRLFRNRGDGTFEDVAERLGVADLNHRGDRRVDGRGVGRLRQRRLRGSVPLSLGTPGAVSQRRRAALHACDRAGRACPRGPTSTPRSGSTSIATAGSTSSSAATTPSTVNLWKLADTRMMPESFEYANNGGRKYLFRNLGDGRFEEVSARVGTRVAPLGAGGGRRRSARHRLSGSLHRERLRRLGAVRQRRRALPRGRPRRRRRLRAEERDERVGRRRAEPGAIRDLRVEHLGRGHPAPGQQPLGADGRRGARCRSYENLARAMGVDLGGWSFGAQFADLNNDGFLDLYLVNGYVSASRRESYWYDFSKIAGGNQIVISDARELAGDGHAQPGRLSAEEGVDQRRRRPLPRRRPDGRRHGSLRRPLGRGRRSRRIAARSTSIVANQRGPLLLYTQRGRTRPRNGLRSISRAAADRLRRKTRCTNRSAIGATVTVFWNGQQQVQEVSGGSGFCAQNQRRLHFGLGRACDD